MVLLSKMCVFWENQDWTCLIMITKPYIYFTSTISKHGRMLCEYSLLHTMLESLSVTMDQTTRFHVCKFIHEKFQETSNNAGFLAFFMSEFTHMKASRLVHCN